MFEIMRTVYRLRIKQSKSERWRRRIKKRRKKQYAKVVGFVLGHQPARIDPAANRPSLASAPRRRSAIEMIPENVAPMTCVATNAGDADGRPAIIGEGPQHLQKNKQQREFQFVFGSGDSDTGIGVCGWILTIICWLLVLVTMPFSFFICFKVVQEYERAVIFRLGRLLSGGAKGPGIFFILPCIETYTKVDLRTGVFDIPPQEVLTKDSVTVSVDAVVYFRVSNATVSVANVENAHHSTRLLAQTTLRNILGTKDLHEILGDRETISGSMQAAALDEATESWGIKVERVEIKDVRLPVQLQRAMAAEAEASREARAKVIAAEGEFKASTALKEASMVIAESPAALQLRYLQTLSTISAEKNSTIIFPLPIDFLTQFMR
ncbi:band 7 protein AGAP004871 isoform X2 [Daphnia magna]|uniref:band 7 protein AGAP004871 isoform X2 n=1 Tax=Daphnia magna TaxID=35525 RepID=UPI001402874E|nr:band 7 protein AGAP004871 isoform X2 [Daphnia magna]